MVRRSRKLAAVLLGFAMTSASCAESEPVPSVAESIDSLMTGLVERGYFVSGAVVAGRDEQILYERGFGLANVAEDVPFTPDTPTHVASMTKTMTATLVLMLQEDGRLRLDDFVAEYIPEFPYADIRIWHLLEHSSGLLPDGPLLALAPAGVDHTAELLLGLLAEHAPPLAFAPGDGFMYSAGLLVAAILVERVTGQSYASLLRDRIFQPLGMDSSFVRWSEEGGGARDRALGYRRSADGTLESFDLPEVDRVKGVNSSARDLYRWVSSFYARPVLGEDALRAGLEAPVLGGGQRTGITSLNWYHADAGRRYYFTGDSHGFYTFSYWDADQRYAFVYTSNTALPNWLRPRLAMALVDILEGRRAAPIEDPGYALASVPAESWDLYAGLPSLDDFAEILGEYEMGPTGRVSIENPPPNWLNIGWMLEDGWFAPVVRVDGGPRYNMFPTEPGILYVPGLDAWAGFKEGDGEPTLHWTRVFEGTSTGARAGG